MLYLKKGPFKRQLNSKQYTKGYIKTEKEQCFVGRPSGMSIEAY